jgi:hypothetical protein
MIKENPKEPVIICFADKKTSVENTRQYLAITDKGGMVHKISDKRKELWTIFDNARDAEPFMLIYEVYQNIRYVADAKPITEDLLKVGIRNVVMKLYDAQTEERNRSQAISYAKDLRNAGMVADNDKMFDMADSIYKFIKGGKPEQLREESEEQ